MTISDEIVAMEDTPAEKVMANHPTKRSIDGTQEVSSKFMKKENGSGKRVSFESFPRKVQQLTLNAIPSSEIDDISLADDKCANASIFYTKLVHWDELNMSQGFTELKRAVHKFSNLPMVIFNQHKILEQLTCQIKKQDPLCLEPLYDLMTGVAQDVQSDFIKFYPIFIQLIADTSRLAKNNAFAIKAAFDSLNQVIKIMQRAFLVQLQTNDDSSEKGSPEDATEGEIVDGKEKGIVSLMNATVKLFQFGVSPNVYGMCGAAISQIIRKASGKKRDECLYILFEAIQSADNSNALIELAGVILSQAIKSTSKSLVVNGEKIWKQMLKSIAKLDWEDNAITRLLETTLSHISSKLCNKDVQCIFAAIFRAWENKADQSEEKNAINVQLKTVTQILSISRSKKLSFEENACKFATLAMKENPNSEDRDEQEKFLNAITELIQTLCQKSSSNKDIPLSLVEGILFSPRMTPDDKVYVYLAVSNLDNFENELLLPVFVRTLIRKYNAAISLPKEDYDRIRLYVMVEVLAEFIKSRKCTTEQDQHQQPFIIEFQCDNPNSLHTLPNRLLALLEKHHLMNSNKESKDKLLSRLSLSNILTCLTAVRPLHENAEEEVGKIMDDQIKHIGADAKALENSKLQAVSLAIQALSDLSCPADLLQKVDLGVIDILCSNVSNTHVAKALSFILYQASLMQTIEHEKGNTAPIVFGDASNKDDSQTMISTLKGKLINGLNTTCEINRKLYLKSLAYLSSDEKKSSVFFQTMLKAENITPNVASYRDRVKHLGNIVWSEQNEDENDESNDMALMRFKGGLRFLLGNLSVNFTPLWDPTIKIIDSYLSAQKYQDISWTIIYEVFYETSEKIKNGNEGISGEIKQVQNLLSLVLKAFAYSSDFIPFVEKKSQMVVNEFLSISRPTSNTCISPNTKVLEAFIDLFKKFGNIRNMSRFNEVKEVVIQYILGHSKANEKILKSAVEFFLAAYKPLRANRDILMELVDNKKWKTRFLALTEETFQKSGCDNILTEIIYQLISARIRRTAKDKRTAQMANRKFIVRTMFQVGLERGLEFVSFFRKRELISIEHLLEGKAAPFEKKLIARKLDITFDVYMMAAKNANCGKDIFSEIVEILLLQGRVVKKEIDDFKREGAAGKRRNKLLENMIQVFSTLKECDWGNDQEVAILEQCIFPLLYSQDVTEQNEETSALDDMNNQNIIKQEKIHYLSKLPKLLQIWADNTKFHQWFFANKEMPDRPNTVCGNNGVLERWVCENVFMSQKIDPTFKAKVFNVVCNLLISLSESTECGEQPFNELLITSKTILPRIIAQFKSWLTPKSFLKRSKDTALRLRGLNIVMKHVEQNCNHDIDTSFFIEKLAQVGSKGTLEVQTQSLHALKMTLCVMKKLSQDSAMIPLCTFKLLTNITNYDNKRLGSKILWNHLKTTDPTGRSQDVALDDNFLHGIYQPLTEDSSEISNASFSEQLFLFLFHFAASEIYNQDFSQRSAAVLCLRDIIRKKKIKNNSNDEQEGQSIQNSEFAKLVDKVLLPVISKGLQSNNDRIQAEFMEILLECIVTCKESNTSFLGSIHDVEKLMSSLNDDQESNFLENMKHIQKHRRGRAMRRLALQLEENRDFLSRDARISIVYPLVRTYIYNKDYISQSDIVNSAITCIAALAMTYSWKDYKNILLQFLLPENRLNLLESPPFRKQRVKILSAILNSFHFSPEEESALKLKDVISKLLKKVTRTGAAGASQDIEDQVDIALFVPILKIMLIYPDNWLKSNLSLLVINLTSKLRSRKIEERTAARDVLCQIVKLLGPNYFQFIFSILEGNLQRGYQLHILLFTTNSVMNAITEGATNPTEKSATDKNDMVGAFDSSLHKLMALIGNEMFGNILEEKRVAALVKKTPEAAKTISFGLLEKLGAFSSKGNIAKILGLLLASNTTHKYITSSTSTSSYESLQKLRKAVKSFQTGIVKNKLLSKEDFLLIAHGLLSGKLLIAFSGDECNQKSNKALLHEMAFQLLCHNASQPTSTGNSKIDAVEEMKPFRSFVTECINEKDVNVVSGCLKYLSLITQNRPVVDMLLDGEEEKKDDFMCLITKKCRQYQPMKNNQPYNYICQILRNLLTHNSNYQFSTPEHLKSICLFFQMCVETNYDDVNAIKLLGLLLFKFYTEEASAGFLKLLCVCTIKCRDEMTFNMTKPIILKIVKRHKTLTPAMAFYSQHVTYEIVDGKYCSGMFKFDMLLGNNNPSFGWNS